MFNIYSILYILMQFIYSKATFFSHNFLFSVFSAVIFKNDIVAYYVSTVFCRKQGKLTYMPSKHNPTLVLFIKSTVS